MKIEVVYRKQQNAKITLSFKASDKKDMESISVFHKDMDEKGFEYSLAKWEFYSKELTIPDIETMDKAKEKKDEIIAVVKEHVHKWRDIKVPENIIITI